MAAAQPKKMLIMHILDILKKYTDEDHRLSQKEIGEILKNEYDMVVDRKSIKRNLMDLIDLGFEIEYSESVAHGAGQGHRQAGGELLSLRFLPGPEFCG